MVVVVVVGNKKLWALLIKEVESIGKDEWMEIGWGGFLDFLF